jgi:hypothetical protein
MQESNILSNYLILCIVLPSEGPIKTKPVGVSGSYNIVVNLYLFIYLFIHLFSVDLLQDMEIVIFIIIQGKKNSSIQYICM